MAPILGGGAANVLARLETIQQLVRQAFLLMNTSGGDGVRVVLETVVRLCNSTCELSRRLPGLAFPQIPSRD
jgi:hypothetical protein